MTARALLLCMVVVLVGAAAGASEFPFEGVVELTVRVDGRERPARAFLRGRDLRIDAELEGVRTSLIVLGGNTDVLAQVLHPTKTYERVRLTGAKPDPSRFSYEPLADAEVLGKTHKGGRLTDVKSGDVFELWLDPALGSADVPDRVWRALKGSDGSLSAALSAHGLGGFPVQLVLKRRYGGRIDVRVRSIKPKRLDDTFFAPPPGYRQLSTTALRRGDVRGALQELGSLLSR